MATIAPKFTLTTSGLTTATTISMSVENSLNVVQPIIGSAHATAPVSSGTAEEIVPTGSDNQYVFIRHTGKQADGTTATTNQLSVLFGSTEGLRISAEEFAFFPSKSDVVVKVLSSSSQTIQVEYAYYTAG